MKNRIEQKFVELKRKKKKAFIAFITAGDPSLSVTQKMVLAFEKAGVDIVELGVPFSDPVADGPTIQAASQRSLKKGTTLKKIFQTVASIRKESRIPIALMTYYNPVFRFGDEKFIAECKKNGVDGFIIPDLPPEEAKELLRPARIHNIASIFFISPTTSKQRIPKIVSNARGFIYYVSLKGVTGSRVELPESLAHEVKFAKRYTSKPVCVGFGVSTPQQVKEIASFADGIIVGSAIVQQMAKNVHKKDLVKNVAHFVSKLTRVLSD